MNVETRLQELGDRLERSVASDLRTSKVALTRARRSRPRLLAGSTLGLAGVGAAVLLALSGTAATPPAYAITAKSDGTVLVRINFGGENTLAVADAKLVAKYHEAVTYLRASLLGTKGGPSDTAPGQSASPAPIECAPTADPGGSPPAGPKVKLLIGKNNTFVLPSDNTGGGATEHLVSCQTYAENPGGNSGMGSGSSSTGNTGGQSPSAPGALTTQLSTGPGNTGG